MMPTGIQTRRVALLTAKLLAFILLALSPRALLAPSAAVSRAQESKRPKSPKNIVRADPIRIPGVEKQGQAPNLAHPHAAAQGLDGGLVRSSQIQALPRKAFTQLTKPDYLKSYSAGIPPIPLAPPA
jgi:hypothetical protein